MSWKVVLLGALAGIISGMGIGGGTVLIPALLFFTDLSQTQAQGVNLLYFIPTAVTALFVHRKQGNLETGLVKPLVLWGFLGAAAGAFLAAELNPVLLKKLFGGFLLLMGARELWMGRK